MITRKMNIGKLVAAFCVMLSMAASAANLAKAPWIGDGRALPEDAKWYSPEPAAEFSASFVLPRGANVAKINFAAAGFAGLSLGGVQLMDEDGLDTLWSVYGKTVYYRSFPVKAGALKPYPAVNTVNVRLGNGFYNFPPLKFWGSKCFRDIVSHGRACFKLEIEGLEKPLEWKWRETNVLCNSVYLGAVVDATAAPGEWKRAGEVAGPKGELVEWPESNPQMVCDDVLVGKAKWLKPGEVQVVDFGVNSSGVPVFRFAGEKHGEKIEIVYGERLNADGSVNVLTQTAGQIKRPGRGGPGAPDVAAQRDAYICRGGEETFMPPFTWHIARYAEVRGAKKLLGEGDAKWRVRSMLSLRKGQAPAAEAFKTGNADIAALHQICRRTFQANLIGGVQSDCPGRERLGYGGDIVSTYEAYMLNFDMREIYLKILRDFADEAKDDGWITETAPHVGIASSGFGGRAGPISWSLAVPELIDGLLRHYNDERALAYYPVCARYVRLVNPRAPGGLLENCIGDHEALEHASRGCIATAHWYRFVELTAAFAKRLGKTADAREFESIKEKIRNAFIEKYVRGGVVDNGTQSAQSTALYLGLVPGSLRQAALDRLVAEIEKNDFHPTTGIFSTRYMLMYLSANGKLDVARRIVLCRGFPGWLYMLERGATTLWETWKESDDVYSNCHPMFGSVDEWILKYADKAEAAGECRAPAPGSRIETPRILAHRGSRGEYQDNGAGGFKRCLAAGVTGFEVDVRYSADGHLVVMHDADIARTTDGKGIVEEMTLADIKSARLMNCSEQVPTIEEVLEIMKGRKDIFIEIEMKASALTAGGRLDAYCDKLHDAAKRILEPGTYVFTSFSDQYLSVMKKRHPAAPIGLISAHAISENLIAAAKELGCCQIAPLLKNSTMELVKRAHDEGLKVTLWPVPSLNAYLRAKDLGADNCTSDYPMLLKKRLKGMRKKVVALDLDATLCQHRSPVPERNFEALRKLQQKYRCVMVGAGNAPRIYRQMGNYPIEIVGNYGMQEAAVVDGVFKITRAVTNEVDRAFFKEKTDYLRKKYGYTRFEGNSVEFHASGMVTFGLLGTSAAAEHKVHFDPNRKKRRAMYPEVSEIFKDYSVYIGGSTSFDFAGKQYNKYTATLNWAKRHGYELEDIVFVGDDFADGGGDSHVRILGMDMIVINDYRKFPEAMAVLLD